MNQKIVFRSTADAFDRVIVLNIKHAEYFIALIEEKSFSKAAERLGVSQPTLSQCLQKLEETFGAPLIDRSLPGCTPTEEGKVFLRSCVTMLDAYRQAAHRIVDLQQGVSGVLRVGISPFRARFELAERVRDFTVKYPRVQVHIVEQLSEEMQQSLKYGSLDLAVTALDSPPDAGLEAKKLYTENVLIAVPDEIVQKDPGLRAFRSRDGVIPVDGFTLFRGVPFILLGDDQLLCRQFKALTRHEPNGFASIVRCTGISTSLALAESGVGATLVFSSGSEAFMRAYPRLRFFTLNDPSLRRDVCLLTRKGQYLTEPLNDFMSLLERDAIGQHRNPQ